MDTFNDAALTPEQIKMLTLQFMGQHVTGDLKELDRNLVAKNQTLQGMVLDPTAVLNTIPSLPQPQPAPQIELQQPALVSQPASIEALTSQYIVPVPAVQQIQADQNQLEFSFETSPLSERIFDALERIEKKLLILEDRLISIEDTKKKD